MEKRLFEIWMDGFVVTGEQQPAQKIGEMKGVDFDDAVQQYMSTDHSGKSHGIEPVQRSNFETEGNYNKRKSNWMVWGCLLFPNEPK